MRATIAVRATSAMTGRIRSGGAPAVAFTLMTATRTTANPARIATIIRYAAATLLIRIGIPLARLR